MPRGLEVRAASISFFCPSSSAMASICMQGGLLFVVLFEQHRLDAQDDGLLAGKEACHVRAAPDPLADSFRRVGAVKFRKRLNGPF